MRYSAVFLLLAAACAKNPTPEGVSASCTGRQLVIVTNDWNEPVEVFARLSDSPTPRSLSIVQPGSREELPMPAGSTEAFVLTTRTIQPSTTPIGMRQQVHLRYQCR
jgi:hypothetical protein